MIDESGPGMKVLLMDKETVRVKQRYGRCRIWQLETFTKTCWQLPSSSSKSYDNWVHDSYDDKHTHEYAMQYSMV